MNKDEQTEHRKMVRMITEQIVYIGAQRAFKKAKGRAWLCGMYANIIESRIELRVDRTFSSEQIRFIVSQLPGTSSAETEFALQDPEHQELCDELNRKLNTLIPKLHVNRYMSLDRDDE